VALGAQAASSPADVASRVETVMTSLPSLDIGMKVVNGEDGLTRGNRVRRYIDLSTTGSRAAQKTAEILKARSIVQIDCPVSGGVAGAEKGTVDRGKERRTQNSFVGNYSSGFQGIWPDFRS
jgi:hypothetical protein